MVLGTALAVIGGLLLLIGLLAVLGLSSIIPGDAVAGGIQGAFSVFLNWWQVWLPIALIGLVAFIARGGRGSSGDGSIVDTAVGAAEGTSRALADGNDSSSDSSSSNTGANSRDQNVSQNSNDSRSSGRQVGQFGNPITDNSSNPSDSASSSESPSDQRNNTTDFSGDSSPNGSNINQNNTSENMANDLELLQRMMNDDEKGRELHQKVGEKEGQEAKMIKIISGIEKTLEEANVFEQLDLFENGEANKTEFYNHMHKAGTYLQKNLRGNVPGGVSVDRILSGDMDDLINKGQGDSELITVYNCLVILEKYIEQLDHVEHEIVEMETREEETSREEINLAEKLEEHHQRHLEMLKNHMR